MLGPDGAEVMRETERIIMLNVIDNQWKDHLLSMDHLKEGIGMRAYGQKDPLVEYKKESFTLFQDMLARVQDETVKFLFFMQAYEGTRPILPFDSEIEEVEEADELEATAGDGSDGSNGHAQHSADEQKVAQTAFQDFTRKIQKKKEKEMADLQFVGGGAAGASTKETVVKGARVGRNDPCPCGSGKKYKKCCGA
jgi:preprotein translocase subunit SecA